ncbi:MAG: hypothetical protein EOQ44_36330 [Mesorhizobium sp.]|nr:MAG: hypothetical protein EOQ44_36330 [Mesorhizobium sp.]
MEVLQRGAWLGSLLVAPLLRYRSLTAPPSRPPCTSDSDHSPFVHYDSARS